MAELDFEWDSRDLKFWRDARFDKALASALLKSGNDALRAMQAASTRSVRQRKRMKVDKVKRGLPLDYPHTREINGLVWQMRVSGKEVPVANFPHRQTKKGVSVAISNGARKLIKGAFVLTMRSGHEGIFKRIGKSRLPITQLLTTRISDVFNDDGMVPAVLARTQAEFARTFDRLLPLEFEKVRR